MCTHTCAYTYAYIPISHTLPWFGHTELWRWPTLSMFSGSGAPRTRTPWEWHSQGLCLPLRLWDESLKAWCPDCLCPHPMEHVFTLQRTGLLHPSDSVSGEGALSSAALPYTQGIVCRARASLLPGVGMEGDLSGDPSLPPATGQRHPGSTPRPIHLSPCH